ncbi:hypothetical protein CFP56_012750 [Quercus suber]|uniref:Uncharacterized protein n=1 Tax=Quercus suber TaxID=58331 RepID=A0AAW0KWJ9_QUESU
MSKRWVKLFGHKIGDQQWGFVIFGDMLYTFAEFKKNYPRKSITLQLHNPRQVLKKFREPSSKRYKYWRRSHV